LLQIIDLTGNNLENLHLESWYYMNQTESSLNPKFERYLQR
jgi:hypothetical protein